MSKQKKFKISTTNIQDSPKESSTLYPLIDVILLCTSSLKKKNEGSSFTKFYQENIPWELRNLILKGIFSFNILL